MVRQEKFVLDLGSHSAKLYRVGLEIEKLETLTWDLLSKNVELNCIGTAIESLTKGRRGNGYTITAIGTEAMRRHPELAAEVSRICTRLAIEYRTLSHSEEADLIARAFAETDHLRELDIINAGGGSIQIISPLRSTADLISVGISDLNRIFNLSFDDPSSRKIDEAIAWISERLPSGLNKFSYTGGEAAYLQNLGVPLTSGYCSGEDFAEMARTLQHVKNTHIYALSPFDPAWMSGAIASNCIVLAALRKSGADSFHASDFNIAHGLVGMIQ